MSIVEQETNVSRLISLFRVMAEQCGRPANDTVMPCKLRWWWRGMQVVFELAALAVEETLRPTRGEPIPVDQIVQAFRTVMNMMTTVADANDG